MQRADICSVARVLGIASAAATFGVVILGHAGMLSRAVMRADLIVLLALALLAMTVGQYFRSR